MPSPSWNNNHYVHFVERSAIVSHRKTSAVAAKQPVMPLRQHKSFLCWETPPCWPCVLPSIPTGTTAFSTKEQLRRPSAMPWSRRTPGEEKEGRKSIHPSMTRCTGPSPLGIDQALQPGIPEAGTLKGTLYHIPGWDQQGLCVNRTPRGLGHGSRAGDRQNEGHPAAHIGRLGLHHG